VVNTSNAEDEKSKQRGPNVIYINDSKSQAKGGVREEEGEDTWAQGPMYASNWKLLMSVGTGRLGSKKVLLSNTMGSFACMFIP